MQPERQNVTPDAMDVCSLHGKKDARRTYGQRGYWVAKCPKRCGKAGHGGKDDKGKNQVARKTTR